MIKFVGQSKLMSVVESFVNTLAGFITGVAVQLVVFPMFGMQASMKDMLVIGAIFTVVHIVRAYIFRRLFNYIGLTKASKNYTNVTNISKHKKSK